MGMKRRSETCHPTRSERISFMFNASFFAIFRIVAQGLIERFWYACLGLTVRCGMSTKLPLPWGIVKDLERGLIGREVRYFSIYPSIFIIDPY